MSEHADAGSLADRLEALDARLAAFDDQPSVASKIAFRGAVLREAVWVLRARNACWAAIDLLARVPYESGTEIGELIEERRSQYAAQAAPSEPEEADPQSPTFGHGRGDKSAAQSVSGSLGAAALPPDAHADARAAREALEWIGGHDTHWRKGGAGGRCDKCAADSELRAEGLAALARLVAALPGAPAEPERAPDWVQCARCYHVWDDADDAHDVCPCLHEHGSRQVWPLTTVEVAALANTSTNLRPGAPAETHAEREEQP